MHVKHNRGGMQLKAIEECYYQEKEVEAKGWDTLILKVILS